MIINQLRTYGAHSTRSRILVNGSHVCEAIEDVGRPHGVKCAKETCIPEGVYFAKITLSARFKRPMILLFTNKSSYSCEHGGIKFDGVRVHKGSKVEHTEGCVCVIDERIDTLEAIIGAQEKSFPRDDILWIISKEIA